MSPRRETSLHRQKRTRTYRSWEAMKRRCTDPNYANYAAYGGRGITFPERWQRFANFLIDMGSAPPDHTLDRIDPEKSYGPDNCRWATRAQQDANRRKKAVVDDYAKEFCDD